MERLTRVSLITLSFFAALVLVAPLDAQDIVSMIAGETNVDRSVEEETVPDLAVVLPCDYPSRPYDPFVEPVPSGSSYCSPSGGHDTYGDVSDATKAAARRAAASAIANTHAQYSCQDCEEAGPCAKEVLVHEDDGQWEYNTVPYFDTHIDANGNPYSKLHTVLVSACLKSGGYFLRTCKACS